jgi:hypothetical protein
LFHSQLIVEINNADYSCSTTHTNLDTRAMAKKEKTTVRKEKTTPAPKAALTDLHIRVNRFGEIEKGYDIDDINAFLNEHVTDKKLTEEDDEKVL